MGSALYIGGNRAPGRTYRLNLASEYSRKRERIHISQEAVDRAPGSIFEMSWQGLQHCASSSSPAFIYIRGGVHATARKVFIAEEEISEIAKRFGLSAPAVTGSFFSSVYPKPYRRGVMDVAPRWQELVDPIWKESFLNWIAGNGRIPDITEIPNWSLFSRKRMTMPAMTGASSIHNPAGLTSGRLIFREFGEQRRATFDHGNGFGTSYALSLDRATQRDRIQFIGFAKRSEDETFDRTMFTRLFGPNPAAATYSFSKRATTYGIGFCNLGGLKFGIRSSRIKYEKDRLFYLDFTREGSSLTIKCYLDPERKEMYGRTIIKIGRAHV
jgi:hypothetical protein